MKRLVVVEVIRFKVSSQGHPSTTAKDFLWPRFGTGRLWLHRKSLPSYTSAHHCHTFPTRSKTPAGLTFFFRLPHGVRHKPRHDNQSPQNQNHFPKDNVVSRRLGRARGPFGCGWQPCPAPICVSLRFIPASHRSQVIFYDLDISHDTLMAPRTRISQGICDLLPTNTFSSCNPHPQ